MIKQENLKYKNDLCYFENKLFTGQSINIYKDKFWFKEVKLHRDNDFPAAEHNNGDKYWYKEGKIHRENDLPTIDYNNGTKFWYKEGKSHRGNDLPAIESINGYKYWYKEGKLHRDNGSVIEYIDGDKSWYFNDEEIDCKNNEEFLKIIKLLLFK